MDVSGDLVEDLIEGEVQQTDSMCQNIAYISRLVQIAITICLTMLMAFCGTILLMFKYSGTKVVEPYFSILIISSIVWVPLASSISLC